MFILRASDPPAELPLVGSQWEQSTNLFGTSEITCVYFSLISRVHVVGCADGTIFLSDDEMTTWITVGKFNGAAGGVFAIADGPDGLIATTAAGIIFIDLYDYSYTVKVGGWTNLRIGSTVTANVSDTIAAYDQTIIIPNGVGHSLSQYYPNDSYFYYYSGDAGLTWFRKTLRDASVGQSPLLNIEKVYVLQTAVESKRFVARAKRYNGSTFKGVWLKSADGINWVQDSAMPNFDPLFLLDDGYDVTMVTSASTSPRGYTSQSAGNAWLAIDDTPMSGSDTVIGLVKYSTFGDHAALITDKRKRFNIHYGASSIVKATLAEVALNQTTPMHGLCKFALADFIAITCFGDGVQAIRTASGASTSVLNNTSGVNWLKVDYNVSLNRFFAVGYMANCSPSSGSALANSYVFANSIDGISWSYAYQLTTTNQINDLAAGAGKFVMAASSGLYQTDDLTTAGGIKSFCSGSVPKSVQYGTSLWMAVGGTSTGKVATTTDPLGTWTEITPPSDGVFTVVRWISGATWIVGSASGKIWRTTNNGSSWTQVLSVASASIVDLSKTDTGAICSLLVGSTYKLYASTDGGVTWALSVDLLGDFDINAVGASFGLVPNLDRASGAYMALGETRSGNAALCISPNGSDFRIYSSPAMKGEVNDFVVGPERAVAVMAGGYIARTKQFVISLTSAIILEDGSYLLLESGDKLLLE